MLKSEEFLAEAIQYEQQAQRENLPHLIQFLLRQRDAAFQDAMRAIKEEENASLAS